MRIDRLDLKAYGHFSEKSIDFGQKEHGLHLIYGDNEAGKSTSLRACSAWLFGIPTKTSDNFIHPYETLRIGGKLRNDRGETLEFIRRKANKNRILASDNKTALDESLLNKFLPSGLDSNLFNKLWGIDYDGLLAGGEELLEQSGDVGHALFSAAVGAGNLQKILSSLSQKSDALFKPTGRKTTINQACTDFNNAKKKQKESLLPVAKWNEKLQQLQTILAKLKSIEEEKDQIDSEISKLKRVQKISGIFAEYRALLDDQQLLQGVLLLPEVFAKQYQDVSKELELCKKSILSLNDKQIARQKDLQGIKLDRSLLENEESINALHAELSKFNQSVQSLHSHQEEQRHSLQEAEKLLKRIRPDLNLEQAEELRPLLLRTAELTSLVAQDSTLKESAENNRLEQEQITLKLKQAEAKYQKIPAENDSLQNLKIACDRARRAGNIEELLNDKALEYQKQQILCQQEFARVGRFTGSANELLSCPLPETATIEFFVEQYKQLSEEQKEIKREQVEWQGRKERAESEHALLLAQKDVPSKQELDVARKNRDQQWQKLHKLFKQDGLHSQHLITDHQLVEYQSSITLADQIADRLYNNAENVAKRVTLELEIERSIRQLQQMESCIEEAAQKELGLQKKWLETWQHCMLNSLGSPREMLQWREKVHIFLKNLELEQKYQHELQDLENKHDLIRNSIRPHANAYIDTDCLESIDMLLDSCQKIIEKEDDNKLQRQQLQKDIDNLQESKEKVAAQAANIATKREQWQLEWQQISDKLVAGGEASPEEAMELLATLNTFFIKFDKGEDLHFAIDKEQRFVEDFRDKTENLAEKLLQKYDPEQAGSQINRLHHELKAAKAAEAEFNSVHKIIKELNSERDSAKIAQESCRQQLAQLQRQAGVESCELIPAAIEKSAQKKRIEDNIVNKRAEILRSGDGLELDLLEQEIHDYDHDEIAGYLENHQRRQQELGQERDDLRDQKKSLEDYRSQNASDLAAEASEEMQEHLATIVNEGKQYLRLQIASKILAQNIEKYRKQNQAPILTRAGEFFNKLTQGAYHGLRDELDSSGKPYLVAVYGDGYGRKVAELSDGSRDQLYLALRLATVEQHLKNGEAIPFIVDDILIGFDDERTKASLEVLAELACQTQILLFTHHKRVIEISQTIEAKTEIHQYKLS